MTRAAYQANGQPVERAAFYALACNPQRSVVVEACAGAGKTWMLVSRILRALLDGAAPHEILAITFTRKAAGEMRERLNEWLREFGSPGTGDGQFRAERATLGDPLVDAAVEHCRAIVTQPLQGPPQPRRPHAAVLVVCDDLLGAVNADATKCRGEDRDVR